MRMILVRHANVVRATAVPSAAWRLSDHGRARAAQFAHQLAPFQPTRMITSAEPKAAETGEIIAQTLGIPAHAAPGLHEHDRRGVGFFPHEADFLAAVARLFDEPDARVFGNETAVEARTRFEHAIHTQLAQHPTGTPAFVTHGTVMALFLAHHNPDLDVYRFWRSLTLPCAVVVERPLFTIDHLLLMD